MPSDYDVYVLNHKELQKYLVSACSILFICGYVFYSNICVAMLFSALAIVGLPTYKRSLAEKRKSELKVQFKDLLFSISSSVTAGRHLNEAIEESEKSIVMIYGENSMMAIEVANMCRIMKETNCSEEAVIKDMADRSKVKEIQDFSDVCITCRRTGGDMNRLILKAASILSQNIDLQREKEVILYQKKIETRILACMPVIVTALLKISSSGYLDVMYNSIAGKIIMTVALASTLGSFLWSMRMMQCNDF